MSNSYHYFPVLRWKKAERQAIRDLFDETKRNITPIFEFVPKDFENKPLRNVARQKAIEVMKNWGWKNLALLDLGNLPGVIPNLALPLMAHTFIDEMKYGVVTAPDRSPQFQDSVKHALKNPNVELSLRIPFFSLEREAYKKQIFNLLDYFGVGPSQVHMVVDLNSAIADAKSILPVLSACPVIHDWQNLVLLGGSFPQDLSNFERHNTHTIPRDEWIRWVSLQSEGVPRLPSFGDYTIQHGNFIDNQGKHFNFSANIRYALHDKWLVYKGEGVRNKDGPGYTQWVGQAQLLVEREEFLQFGESFSSGDKFFYTTSKDLTQNAQDVTAWIAASANHHLHLVVNQLRRLQGQTPLISHSNASTPTGREVASAEPSSN